MDGRIRVNLRTWLTPLQSRNQFNIHEYFPIFFNIFYIYKYFLYIHQYWWIFAMFLNILMSIFLNIFIYFENIEKYLKNMIHCHYNIQKCSLISYEYSWILTIIIVFFDHIFTKLSEYFMNIPKYFSKMTKYYTKYPRISIHFMNIFISTSTTHSFR